MIKKVLIISVCICLLSQCTSDEKPVFSGITETSLGNELIGAVDETDWKINEKWDKKVVKLFSDLNISDINNLSFSSIDDEIEKILNELGPCFVNGRTNSVCDLVKVVDTAYPNPARYNFQVGFNIYKASVKNFKLVMVNQGLEPLTTINEYSTNYQIELSSLKPGIYRVYYLIQTTHSEFVLKGHGDVMKK